MDKGQEFNRKLKPSENIYHRNVKFRANFFVVLDKFK